MATNNETNKIDHYTILKSMSEVFYSMHLINLKDDTVAEINAKDDVKEIVNHKDGAIEMMREVISSTTNPSCVKEALEFTDLSTVASRMQGKKVISSEFIGLKIGWFLAMFVAMDFDEEGKPINVIFSTRIIDEEMKEKERLIRTSYTDELTGAFNRRTYEEDVYVHNDVPYEDDFVYFSFDVNGLKVVNDTLGHVAGDELIIGACKCIKQGLGQDSRIYRLGGDEFVAIVFADKDKIKKLTNNLDNVIDNWKGVLIDNLSLSYGYATKEDYPNYSVRELASVAEKKMYEAKALYYSRMGLDRRGQQEAHKALCNLYTKILKINLTTDTYQIINMYDDEKNVDKGFCNKISEWLENFGKSGQVHKDDLSNYLEKTNIDFLRNYFKQDKTSHTVFYRRKYNDTYKQVMMEIILASDYSNDNQSLFLYVKNIDK